MPFDVKNTAFTVTFDSGAAYDWMVDLFTRFQHYCVEITHADGTLEDVNVCSVAEDVGAETFLVATLWLAPGWPTYGPEVRIPFTDISAVHVY